MNFIAPQQAQPRREFALCVRAGFGVETMKIKMNEKAFSCRITQKNKFPNGGRTTRLLCVTHVIPHLQGSI